MGGGVKVSQFSSFKQASTDFPAEGRLSTGCFSASLSLSLSISLRLLCGGEQIMKKCKLRHLAQKVLARVDHENGLSAPNFTCRSFRCWNKRRRGKSRRVLPFVPVAVSLAYLLLEQSCDLLLSAQTFNNKNSAAHN